MNARTQARYEARAAVLKALAHPTRLFLVEQLAAGERCVCELTDRAGADMSTVSKHLALLKAVGLVSDERRGTQVFYRLEAPCILKFLDCTATVVRSRARAQLESVAR